MGTSEIVAVLLLVIFLLHWRKSSLQNYPPGPKGLPIVGNVFDIPSSMPWKKFTELSKIYGTLFTDLDHGHILMNGICF